MSDLSRLLDDVYRTGPATPVPAWAPETKALDEVFSNWIPGPAPAAEPEVQVVPDADPEPTLDLREASRPRPAGLVWSIADDDILPTRRRRFRFRRSA